MIAAADLMARGYEVFRSLGGGGSCDLIVVKDREPAMRIEVKTGHRSDSGSITYATPNDFTAFDVLAIVVDDGEVVYRPGLDEMAPTNGFSDQGLLTAIRKGVGRLWEVYTDGKHPDTRNADFAKVMLAVHGLCVSTKREPAEIDAEEKQGAPT
jgi:hypothetical protein